MADQSVHTDADVHAMAEALLAWRKKRFPTSTVHVAVTDLMPQARHLLDAVAPAIAARALREAASALFASSAADFGRIGPILTTKQAAADTIYARADGIQGKPTTEEPA